MAPDRVDQIAHWGWGGMMVGWMLFWLLLLVAAIVLARWLGGPRRGTGEEPRPTPRPSAEEILAERYARGEIDRETYLRMRQDLGGPPPA